MVIKMKFDYFRMKGKNFNTGPKRNCKYDDNIQKQLKKDYRKLM